MYFSGGSLSVMASRRRLRSTSMRSLDPVAEVRNSCRLRIPWARAYGTSRNEFVVWKDMSRGSESDRRRKPKTMSKGSLPEASKTV